MNKTLIKVFATLLVVPACSDSSNPYAGKFTSIDADWAVTADEAFKWALVKDTNRPAMTGSPAWNNHINFLEKKLTDYGVVDKHHKSWTCARTCRFVDDSVSRGDPA